MKGQAGGRAQGKKGGVVGWRGMLGTLYILKKLCMPWTTGSAAVAAAAAAE